MSESEVCQLAYTGNLGALEIKLTENSDLARRADQSGRQPLHWACSAGHTAIVDYLLCQFDIDCDIQDETNWTPLMIAASAGREQIVKNLIASGAKINVVNSTGQCPLHYAASKDRYELSDLLLVHGADANIADWMGSTPLHRTACKGHVKLTKLLLSYSADTSLQDAEGNTPLHLACEDEQPDTAKLLVESGASTTIQNKAEKTPLDLAPVGMRRQLEKVKSYHKTPQEF